MSAVYINIAYTRGSFSLKMNVEIPEGIIGVFGASGHGKSSLLKLLAGIEDPDWGRIVIHGKTMFDKDLKIKVPARRRRMGLVFQEGRLFPHMSVRKNLMYGYQSSSSIHFNEVVSLLELGTLLSKKPRECSGGEKQRIAIGRMLLGSPEVLMLDEPFSALDQRLRRNIIPYLIKIHERYRLPILVVSHDISDLLMLTNQLLIVEDGTIAGFGHYHDLLFDPQCQPLLMNGEEANAVRLRAQSIDRIGDLTAFYYYSEYSSNCLLLDTIYTIVPDDQIILSIPPANVSLSKERIALISSRNQLQGTVTDIKFSGKKVFCSVDVGFPLLVEITRPALEKLDLKVGDPLFCLFKTVSMKILSIGK
ncbi:molybdenum ABC transporter ATP-binding protein [Gaoshiqia sediminis]|uniref:Molybdenum ABC transporter ATP-binding protein n=1 Tax=Gaoshiqia sediminis TaxID=2986998 RepID=A0AA41Y980_9BACT|nr:molybdenum ABC transporter ATP-binding protein [Gaoshiqia sediminis]MCW0481718.1 molybdenum ABC transporter ATP-binding protein [Gaoshiqia sediminis]